MKHLQKLPKNVGDNILLGTIVAVGIQTARGELFVSFDCNGELKTYIIENPHIANQLVIRFKRSIFAVTFDYEFADLTARDDIKFTVIDKNNVKLYSTVDEEDCTVISLTTA